ncbi:hypothetical protein SESBI_43852 [Sesbania bispinosa]|nr:hypothetical protein SESBI_43852 [Sesbania bispinosa]
MEKKNQMPSLTPDSPLPVRDAAVKFLPEVLQATTHVMLPTRSACIATAPAILLKRAMASMATHRVIHDIRVVLALIHMMAQPLSTVRLKRPVTMAPTLLLRDPPPMGPDFT